MNRIAVCFSVTMLMTATSYGMDTEKLAIKELNPYKLSQYKVTLPNKDIITQRIQGLNAPDTLAGAEFDKKKLIDDLIELENTVTISSLLTQTYPVYKEIIKTTKTDYARVTDYDYYSKHLRPHHLNMLKVLLQDQPEHEALMARIDELKLI